MKFQDYIILLNKSLKNINEAEISKFIELIINASQEEKFVFVIGNGGSAANASHLAEDLAKGTKSQNNKTKRIKALSLTDNTPFITAQANDNGYDTIFVEQLITYASPGDLVIAISGSGNSPNIIKAIEWANENKLITAGITGYDGGKLKTLAHHSINVNLNDMCTTESIHSVIFHYIVIELLKRLKSL